MGEDPRYPTGKYVPQDAPDGATIAQWMGEIEAAPALLRRAVGGLSPEQLDTPYREGGWTPRQIAHHVPDSHMNAYVRFRLALTEDQPVIKPYDESLWAELADARSADPELSLALLAALHARWAILLRSLSPADLERTFRHPAYDQPVNLARTLGLYAWHGRHHAGQVQGMRQARGW